MSEEKKKIVWGHVWATKSENPKKIVEIFYPQLGRDITQQDCIEEFKRMKADKEIGSRAKPRVFRVILEELTTP